MRRLVIVAVGIAVGSFCVRPAFACGIDRVIGEHDASPVWQGAVARLAHDLESSPECAVITVTLGNDGALIDVTTPDGRVAERAVTAPRELSSVTFGLLASIPVESAPPAPLTMSIPSSELLPPEPLPLVAPIVPARDKIQPSIGISLGSRFEVPFGVVASEVELRTDVRIRRWILSAAAFGSPVGTRLAEDAIQYREWGLGGEAGRWIPLGGGGIALTAGPGYSSTAFRLHQIHRERGDFAVQTAARYIAPFGSTWHPTFAAALDTLPAIAFDSERKHEDFPGWSASLRFGVAGAGF